MEEGDSAAAAGVLAGEHYCGGHLVGEFLGKSKKTNVDKEHLLHSEVPNVPSELASAGGAAGELRPAVGADEVARVALWREGGEIWKERFESTEA